MEEMEEMESWEENEEMEGGEENEESEGEPGVPPPPILDHPCLWECDDLRTLNKILMPNISDTSYAPLLKIASQLVNKMQVKENDQDGGMKGAIITVCNDDFKDLEKF